MVDQLAPDDLVEDVGPSTEELTPGTRLGRYELLLAIAKGGMARVWAARQHGQRGFSKTVAIKTILPHLAEEPEFERMFLDEARIAALIHHPNVCEIYELGEEGKVLYLAMEWVNGESLVHILRSSGKMAPMEPRLCARIIADACAGLHAAHQLTDDTGRPMNVVHRDVSPHNILVGADGNVKVADFGVAKALGQMHSATVAGQVKGKISYMAPEQIAGAAADRRVDVFAMGVVLYEATTGRRPFTGEGDAQVMHAIMGGQFTPPSRVIRGYPPELEQIVLTAMAQDPARRFPTAERMRMALEEYLARSGPIVTQSHVGMFVHQCVGGVLDRRRARIRAAANAPGQEDISGGGGAVGGTPSAPAHAVASGVHARGQTPSGALVARADATGPSIVARPGPQVQQAPSAAKYVLAAAIGVTVVAGLGAVGIVVARNRAMQQSAVVTTTPTAHPTVSAAPPATSTRVEPALSPSIELRGLPQEAVLHVDGKALGAGVRTVARPAHGATTQVAVTATGFANQTVTLDERSPSSVDVALTIQTPPTQPADTSTGATPTTTKPNPTGHTGTAPTHKVALPANPY
jgi:tRNA A-37 threonylcarbamoyl transferase component Bud32